MRPDEHLQALQTEGARLGAAARTAGLATAVPTCPGWSVADLLVHTAGVFRHKTHVLTTRARERPARDVWRHDVPPEAEVAAWYDDELRSLVDALAGSDPSTAVWTWRDERRTARFWFRRMAQEAVVHRADAEAALGDVGPVPTALALDGVDEVLDLFLVPGLAPGVVRVACTVHLHATDEEGEWLLLLGPDGAAVERDHAKGDAAARGTASDLLLWLWGRVGDDRLETFGDPAALAALRAATASAT